MFRKARLFVAAAAALAVAASLTVLAPIAVAVLDVVTIAVLAVHFVLRQVSADLQALCRPVRDWRGYIMLVRLQAYVAGTLRRSPRSKRRPLRPAA